MTTSELAANRPGEPHTSKQNNAGASPSTDGPRSQVPDASPTKVSRDLGVEYVEIIPKKLSICTVRKTGDAEQLIDENPDLFFFSSHAPMKYVPYAMDFGPVDLSVVHQYVKYVKTYFFHPSLIKNRRQLVFYCPHTMEAATNAAFLIGCFLVIELHWRPEDAWKPFESLPPHLLGTFCDATEGRKDYSLSVLSCLKGLSKAIKCKWYNPLNFNEAAYTQLADPSGANMHFITPKLVAFQGPTEDGHEFGDTGPEPPAPKACAETFKKLNISAVVRLNSPHYDRAEFTKEGIRHYDLYFEDCTTPSSQIRQEFINIVNREPGTVAVHCRAGLGRTGTLIAVHMMMYHGFEAAEAIAWLRIVRPGSVLGPQQNFLHRVERALLRDKADKLPACNRILGSGSTGSTSTSTSRTSSSNSRAPTAPSEETSRPSFDSSLTGDQTIDSEASERMGEVVAQAQRRRAEKMLHRHSSSSSAGQHRPAEPEVTVRLPELGEFKLPELGGGRKTRPCLVPGGVRVAHALASAPRKLHRLLYRPLPVMGVS